MGSIICSLTLGRVEGRHVQVQVFSKCIYSGFIRQIASPFFLGAAIGTVFGGPMEVQTPSSLKGQFLLAMPQMADPNFSKTVTCLTEHNEEGALGIVVNRIYPSLSAKDLFCELKLESTSGAASIPLHIGGPVHSNALFVIHGPPFDWEECHMITETLALSNTRDIFEAIGMEKGPASFLISLGFAGWGAGQLENEVRENAWLTSDIDEEIIFNSPIEPRWEVAIRNMGIDPASLSDVAGHA